MTLKVCFLDRSTIRDDIMIKQLSFDHSWIEYEDTPQHKTINHIADADIVITNKVVINEDILNACPTIKLIAVAATGLDIIDLKACEEKGVEVKNIQNYALNTVPEHVLTVMLMLKRQVLQYRSEVIKGRWQKEDRFCFFDKPIYDLTPSVFGVIGFGALGQATADLMNKLGMQVIYYNRSNKDCDYAEQVELETLIQQADVISCHCALTEETANLLSTAQFNQMKPSALVINTARGGVIDEAALAEALTLNKIAGAAIDVLPQEPPDINSPMMRIADTNNVIVTPHMAWGSQQAMQGLADQLIDNIEQFHRQLNV